MSLLEAMARGLACVATDAGADGEVLEAEAGVTIKTPAGVGDEPLRSKRAKVQCKACRLP